MRFRKQTRSRLWSSHPARYATGFSATSVVEADELLSEASRGERADYEPVSGDAFAYATYTSGTTGPPKAAIHRHRDMWAYVDAMCRGALQLTAQDVALSTARMHFAYGLGNSVWFPLATGGSAIISRATDERADGRRAAAKSAPSVLYGVPTFFARVIENCSPDSFRVRCVVWCPAGEALGDQALSKRLSKFFGDVPILDGLGSTEVGQTFVSNSVDAWRPGTLGKVLPPYEIRVVTPDGAHRRAGS